MIKDTILTNRLILRELKKEDDHDWFEIFSSPKVGEFLHQISDIESAQRMINKKIDKYQNRPGQSFSVLLRGDSANKVIGNVELKIDEAESVAEVSYVFNVRNNFV